jgi:hypothetical protein
MSLRKQQPASIEIGTERTTSNVDTQVEDVVSTGSKAAVRIQGESIVRARVSRVAHVADRSRWISLGTAVGLVGLALTIWQVFWT